MTLQLQTRTADRDTPQGNFAWRPRGLNTGLVGESPAMLRLREAIQQVSRSDRPVLVTGPTGSGKELVVRALHGLSHNAAHPLFDVNCSGFQATLIDSELFGHERGAFTGAVSRREGLFSAVGKGTLFLDEIAELPLELQAKLLRVLETGTYRPVGSNVFHQFAGRVVAATHADLRQRVAQRQFREDLFYRLSVLDIDVPSLDQRREDIPALVAHFAAHLPQALDFSCDALTALVAAEWPGNVRQLRNLVDRLAVYAPDSRVTAEVIRRTGGVALDEQVARATLAPILRVVLQIAKGNKVEFLGRALIDEALRLSGGNTMAAARLLGVHRNVVRRALTSRSLTPVEELVEPVADVE